MKETGILALLAVVFLLGCSYKADSVMASIHVPLTVTDFSGSDRISEPVSSGVPLPQSSNITSINQLKITDAIGNTVPAQFTVLSRWTGTPDDATKPVKWVLLDFQANVPANSAATYYLQDDGSGNAASSKLSIQANSDNFIISTGKAKFQISKAHFNLFDYVWTDNNNLIVSQPDTGGIVLTDKSGKQFTALLEAPEQITLEDRGPMRATVEIRGVLKATDGTYFAPSITDPSNSPSGAFSQPYPHSFVYYNARIQFYNNKEYARLFLTLENNGANGRTSPEPSFAPVQVVYFTSVNLVLNVNGLGATTVSSEDATAPLNPSDALVLYQDWKENLADASKDTLETIFDNGVFYNTKKNGQPLSNGKTNPGWVDLNDATRGVGIAIRQFWQNFPKKITATPSQIVIGLWPEEGYYPYCQKSDFPGPQFDLYCGQAGRDGHAYLFDAGRHKTYEMILDFYSGPSKTQAMSKSLERPLMALAPSDWFVQTKALGLIAPYNMTSSDSKLNEAMQRFEKLQSAMVYDSDSENGITINNLKTKNPPDPMNGLRENRFFGWMNFGDLFWEGGSPSSLHYDWPYSMFLHYLRTGKRNFFDSGVEMIKHRYDIDQYHGDRTDKNNNHKYRNHMQFYESDGHADPTMAYMPSYVAPPTHTWVGGLMLYYLLTGDRKALEGAEEVGKGLMNNFGPGGLFDANWPSQCPDDEIRLWTWSILNLVHLYRLDGNSTFLEVAKNMTINWLLNRESIVGEGHWGCNQDSGACVNQLQPFACQPVGCRACANGQWDTMYAYAVEPLITIHYETNEAQIGSLLVRMADFAKNKFIFGGDSDATGKYRGLQTAYLWAAEDPDCKVRKCTGEVVKGMFWADLFAYAYRLTSDSTYLGWARRNFEDAMFYYALPTGYNDPNSRSVISFLDSMYPGSETKVHGWIGRDSEIYLSTEYTISGKGFLSITTSSLAPSMFLRRYSQTLSATGGSVPYTWSVISGSLPPGISLNRSTGVISGSPRKKGNYKVTIRVSDSSSQAYTCDQAFEMVVSPTVRK